MTEKSRWEIYKEKNGVTVFDLVNPNKVASRCKISSLFILPRINKPYKTM